MALSVRFSAERRLIHTPKPEIEAPIQVVACLNEKKVIRVLHVDDDAGFLKIAQECLKMAGHFEVDTAFSVEEALSKLKAKEYDAVVSDYQMPGKDGLEFLKQLRKKGNDIPFIILTGKGREEVAIKALNMGADRYLSKTGDPETVYCELAHSIKVNVERKKANEAVLAERERLETVTKNIGAGLAIISKDYHTLWANDVLKQIFGNVESKLCYSAYNQRNDLCPQCGAYEIFETGKAKVVHEQMGEDVDRKTIWSEITATPIKDKDENIIAVLELVVPITQRKKAEEALKESEEKFKSLVESTSDWIWQADKNGVYTYASPKIKDILGYEPEEVVDKIAFDLMPKYEGKRKAKFLREIAEKKEPFHGMENWNIHKNGTAVLLETSGIPIFDQKGDLIGYRGISRDVTRRKKTEAELRRMAAIVTDSNDAITVVDMDGKITAWNKGAEDTYGYHKEEALGMNVITIVPEDKKQETLDVIEKIKTNETVKSLETKRLTKDGRVLDVSLTVTKLVDDEGNAVALATTERDITDKKRLEERLRFSEKFTTLGQLASSVAHEIRNPLGVINNSVYFLNIRLKEHPDEKVVKHLKIMGENINSADRIVSDLLDIARNKVGVFEQVDLNEIFERALASLFIPENIKVITRLDKIPKMMLDPGRIQRVFLNIIQNAIAAMPEGGKLIVGLTRFGDSVEISFKDSGAGISEENMQKLFTPLFTTKTKGLGLGLSICKQIVEGHGGDIVAKSKAGEGALFIVRLPILSGAKLVKAGLLPADVLIGGISK